MMFRNKIRVYTAAKRAKVFFQYIESLGKPVRLLDIGGTFAFWERMGLRQEHQLSVSLLNNHHIDKSQIDYSPCYDYIDNVYGDANELTRTDFANYDVVFSNSMLEHLDSKTSQERLTAEILASGKPFFIQVPNKYSLIDPHFPHPFVPFFAAYPKTLQTRLLTIGAFGGGEKYRSLEQARERFKYYNPISRGQIRKLLPPAHIITERHLGIPMSIIAMRE